MSTWDDEAGYDLGDPKHPDRANAAQGLKDLVRGTPPRRYPCPEGCGASFLTGAGRDAHFLVEHGKDAA